MRIRILRAAAACALTSAAYGQTGASLVGTLLDSGDDPVTCAAVVVDGEEIMRRLRVTDEEGSFTVNNLPAGDYTIEIYAPGLVPVEPGKAAGIVDEFTVTEEQAQNQTEIPRDYSDLEFRGEALLGTVAGRLVEATEVAKGPAAPGVRLVRVTARDADCGVLDFTYTCADGSFELKVPDTLVGARLEFTGGAVLESGLDFELSNDDLTALGDIEVVPAESFDPAAIRFSITDADDGDAIPMARIIGRNSADTFTVFTNCTGVVEIDGLQAGGYSLTISAPGYQGRFRSVTAGGPEILLFETTLELIDPDEMPMGGCPQSMGSSTMPWAYGDMTVLMALALTLFCMRRENARGEILTGRFSNDTLRFQQDPLVPLN